MDMPEWMTMDRPLEAQNGGDRVKDLWQDQNIVEGMTVWVIREWHEQKLDRTENTGGLVEGYFLQ